MNNTSSFKLFLFTLLSISLTVGCAHFADNARDKEKSKIYLQLAADQFAQREYNKAVESSLEALKLDPESAAAYNHLGIIYLESKRYQKAEESLKQALLLQPNYPEAHNNYGVLLNRTDKFIQAVAHFEKAISSEHYLTPENALTNLGYAYYRLGKTAKAKEYHQKALDIIPEFCLANKNMGDVYAKEKNYKMATDFFQRAITTCPLYEESQYKLGLALMKQGDRTQAKAKFERLIQQHKTGPYVDRSQEVLKLLH